MASVVGWIALGFMYGVAAIDHEQQRGITEVERVCNPLLFAFALSRPNV
jgi:hypothetical protein